MRELREEAGEGEGANSGVVADENEVGDDGNDDDGDPWTGDKGMGGAGDDRDGLEEANGEAVAEGYGEAGEE